MSLEIKAKYLKYLLNKNNSKGFTLIELLVVIIIIGILAAIALPNFLNQSTKAKQSEAKQYVASVNKAQAGYRIENTEFANSFDQLNLGILTGASSFSTNNYGYEISASIDTSSILAISNDTALKGYAGANYRYIDSTNQAGITSIICEANTPGQSPPVAPEIGSDSASLVCNSSSRPL